jgi:alkylglycerol monooxygenase
MEQYGKILVIAMPAFLVLIIIEKIYGIWKKNDTIPIIDAISSLYSGITNAVKDVLKVSVTLISYEFLVNHFAIFTVENTILVYLIAFVVIDFYGYWTHRLSHQVNILWNKHAIHHSSEEFNLPCALRQSVSSFVNLFTFLLIPAAIFGVPAQVVAVVLPLHLFMQFWYHTKHIDKMGFLEKIIVTPAHHRVHHAINPIYMDKNHGQIFILWDKLFGTFQEELSHEPAVFGITRPANTWNPIVINYQHLALLIHDFWRSKQWKDKLLIWFKPTGWRPDGFENQYPVSKITNIFNFQKYHPKLTSGLYLWTIFQFVIVLIFVFHLFNDLAIIGLSNIYLYGFYIFTLVFSATEMMNTNKYAIIFASIQTIVGFSIMYYLGNWFGNLPKIFSYFIAFYLVLMLMVYGYYFKMNYFKE